MEDRENVLYLIPHSAAEHKQYAQGLRPPREVSNTRVLDDRWQRLVAARVHHDFLLLFRLMCEVYQFFSEHAVRKLCAKHNLPAPWEPDQMPATHFPNGALTIQPAARSKTRMHITRTCNSAWILWKKKFRRKSYPSFESRYLQSVCHVLDHDDAARDAHQVDGPLVDVHQLPKFPGPPPGFCVSRCVQRVRNNTLVYPRIMCLLLNIFSYDMRTGCARKTTQCFYYDHRH